MILMTLIGLPFSHVLFPKLPSRGYLFAKPLGLLVYSFVSWLLLSSGAFTNTPGFLIVILCILVVSVVVAGIRSTEFVAEIRNRRWQILAGELVFAVAFLVFALYRARNPEIVGTEKPMEFAILNSVMRSSSFPPPDPWLSGFSLNYYYFGFFIGGVIANLAGTAASIAFNLFLITIFSLTAMVTFSLGRDLLGLYRNTSTHLELNVTGGLAAFFVLAAGNMTSYQFIIDSQVREKNFWQGLGWNASRVLQRSDSVGELQDYTITEFPAFSFVLGDLHPHLIALPFTMLATACALNWLLWGGNRSWSYRGTIPLTIMTALILGALNVINPWDYPSFTALTIFAGLVGVFICGQGKQWLCLMVHLVIVIVLSLLFYLPYHLHFQPFFTQLGLVTIRSTIGPFMIIFGFWIVAAVVLGAYRLGRDSLPGRWTIVVISTLIVVLWISNVPLSVLLLCTLLMAFMIIQSMVGVNGDSRLVALPLIFFAGFGLAAVPEIVFVDDFFSPPYERMNTVFKIYFQAWPLLAVASAPALCVFMSMTWGQKTRTILGSGATALISILFLLSILYPIVAGRARIAEHQMSTLDGLAFAKRDQPAVAEAADWLQNEAPEDSILLEAVGDAYSSYSRISAWTGIPTVIGWPQHEMLWRGDRQLIDARVADVDIIFGGTDPDRTFELLNKYDVHYIFVGPMEREKYGPDVASRFSGYPLLFSVPYEVAIYGMPMKNLGG